jgi:murein DD-endopeptidase MepM/ murein hydrolase activator NlpD
MNLVYPLEKKGVKTSGFGNREHPVKGDTIHHNGIDIGVPDGTSVISVTNGEVVRSDMKDKNGYGNFIIVKHNVDGETFFSCYAHLTKRLVDVGDKVKKGEKIAESGGGQGISGGGGMSTGPHLHFEIRKSVTGGWTNPEPYISGTPITKGFGGKENKKDLSDDGLGNVKGPENADPAEYPNQKQDE